MLKSNAKWEFPEKNDSESIQSNFPQKLSPILKELLFQRGITNTVEVEQFLSPQLSELYAPSQLKSMEKAVARVRQAIEDGEKILVFGDYDADGVSSTTLMLEVLSKLSASCDYYIPNRFTEGYGPNKEAFLWAAEAGFKLIITVDTGIAAHEELQYASELELDVIVTDHHEIQYEVPEAFAVLHPDCSPEYPFKELAGVGVAFKFAEALLGYLPETLLDLVALGTIADMVSLRSENRILAACGLNHLATSTRPGVKALKKVYDIDDNLNEETVGFKLAPALNAVGRLQSADLAIELLTAQDEGQAIQLAEEVKGLNEKRKGFVRAIVSEAEKMIDSEDKDAIVVAHPDWNPGVLGIVASRLVRKFNRPAIVLAIDTEKQTAKGSARSIPSFDIFKNGMSLRELFTHFGGHAQAAGMTLPVENIEHLRVELGKCVRSQLSKEDFNPILRVSDTVEITEVDEKLVNDLSLLAPFGMNNPKPIFQIKDVPTEIRQIGSANDHLKMQFKSSHNTVDAIGFGMGSKFWNIASRTSVSIVGELGINEWNGHKKVQMVMQDIAIAQWQLFDHRGRHPDHLPDAFVETDTVAVLGNGAVLKYANLTQIRYSESIDHLSDAIDTLIITDLPSDLNDLASVISKIIPGQIHVCYKVEDSKYLKPFPSREDFKWFYGLIARHSVIDLHQELQPIMAAKSWSKDHIVFMAQVFRELEFINIDNGIIKMNSKPARQDLSESSVYQSRLCQRNIEQILYYSPYDELKAWFADSMKEKRPTREAVTNGL